MTPATLAALVGLALVDSTSFGTLLLPMAMLAHERIRPGRAVLYLAVIGGFHALLGLALLAGADIVVSWWATVGEARTTSWVLLVVGMVMLVASFWRDTVWAKRKALQGKPVGTDAASSVGVHGRRTQWRDRLVGEQSRASTVAAVAIGAGLVEAASMLPYLGAIGIMSTATVAAPTWTAARIRSCPGSSWRAPCPSASSVTLSGWTTQL